MRQRLPSLSRKAVVRNVRLNSRIALEDSSAAHFRGKPDEQFLHMKLRGRAAQCTFTEMVSILLIARVSERDLEIERIGFDVLSTGLCNLDCALVRIRRIMQRANVVYGYFREATCGNFSTTSGNSSGTLSVETPTNTARNAHRNRGDFVFMLRHLDSQLPR